MEYFDKKITYLRGLCDGSGFDPDTKEGKIFHGIMDVLEDMAFMLETFMDDEELGRSAVRVIGTCHGDDTSHMRNIILYTIT